MTKTGTTEIKTPAAAYEALLAGAPLPDALPRSNGNAYEPGRIEEVFDAFRRHIAALQSEVYELKTQAAERPDPLPGSAARAETLQIVRAATELAQQIEQEARDAAARQITQLAEELAPRKRELHEREAAIERERVEIIEAAQAEAHAQLEGADRRAAEELTQARAQAEKILQQARREASELRASAQSEVEQMLDRARVKTREASRRTEKAPPSPPPPSPAERANGKPAAPPAPERTNGKPAPRAPGPTRAREAATEFTTPPLSLEDLAARGVTRLRSESDAPE